MSDKRRCQGTLNNPKHPEQGRRCNRWAVNGKDFCAVHGGASELSGFANPENLKNRCVARSSRTSTQCKRPALPGMRVCRNHGGATKASRAKAQELLDRMVEPVLWELRDIALNPSRAMSEGERLRAIAMVLDRTMPKEVKHEIEVKPWEITMQQIIVENGAPSLNRQPSPEQVAELESFMPEDHRVDDDYDDIEEAEIVEEDPRDFLPQIRPTATRNASTCPPGCQRRPGTATRAG